MTVTREEARRARLATALRDNLKRRKTKARALADGGVSSLALVPNKGHEAERERDISFSGGQETKKSS